jgi:predicted membrane metal-binding protein
VGNGYTFIWTIGAVLIACAAWVGPAPPREAQGEMVGFRAIALPLAVQLLAACIQIYLLVSGLGVSVADRVVTIAVLLIASLQIVVSRPRDGESRRKTQP